MHRFIFVLLIGLVHGRADSQASGELDRIQLGVVLSPRTVESMGAESETLRRVVETALSDKGMGTALSNLPTRFVAYVDLVPLQEAMISGGMTVVKHQVSITFGDRTGGRAIGTYVTDARAVGKSKPGALRNLSTSLNLRQRQDWDESLGNANARIIDFFERECASVLREADLKVQMRQFEEAIYSVTTVPREASTCHRQAMLFATKAYTALLRHQCSAPFAAARATWASSKTRESANRVAETLGAIPADSPCFDDATLLLNDVAAVIATFDAAAARERTEELALKRKAYEQKLALARGQQRGEIAVTMQAIEAARQVGLERARAYSRAGPPSVTQMNFYR